MAEGAMRDVAGVRWMWTAEFAVVLCGTAPAFAAQPQPAPAKLIVGARGDTMPAYMLQPRLVTLTDEWAMSQRVTCGEVRGRLRALNMPQAPDTILRPVVGSRVRLLGADTNTRYTGQDVVISTGDDGTFRIAAPVTGLWRLELMRAGLPRVTIPLDFAAGGGYVVDVVMAASQPRDERFGGMANSQRAALDCTGPQNAGSGSNGAATAAVRDILSTHSKTVRDVTAIVAVAGALVENRRRGRATPADSNTQLLDAQRAALEFVMATLPAESGARASTPVPFCVGVRDNGAEVPASEALVKRLTTPQRRVLSATQCVAPGDSMRKADSAAVNPVRLRVMRAERATDAVFVVIERSRGAAVERERCSVRLDDKRWIATCSPGG
jgi:hypothetical protein